MKNGRKHTISATAAMVEAESGPDGDQQRPSKRVKLEQDIDADVQLLHSMPGPSGAGGESVSAPAAGSASGQSAPAGRPNKRKRGWPRKSAMTREQREQELLNDPRTSAVEPGQVLCRMCGHWIKLCRQSDFALQNWNTHSLRCQEKTGWLAKVKREPESAFDLTVADLPAPQTDVHTQEAPNIKEEGRTVPIRGRRGLSNEERRQILEQDQRLKKVEPHLVVCASCDHVVKLHRTRPYELWNWVQHAKKCALKRAGRAGEVSSGVTTDDATVVDDATIESDTEVEAALVVRPDPSPLGLAVPHENVHPSDIAQPVPTDLQNNTLDTELDNSRAASSSHPIPLMTPISVKRELSDYAPLVLPYGSSLSTNPPPLLSPAPVPAASISAPLPKKPTPPAKVSTARHNKKGRNEEERKKALENDPRCSEVRPHEVFCLLCKRWIKLYKEVSYIDSNWLRHAERCELRHGAAPRKKPRLASPVADAKLVPENNDAPVEGAVAESSQASTKRMRELQNDSRITKVEAHQVLCEVCKQWVKLQPYRDYDTWNWRKHILNCEQRNRQGAARAPAVPDNVELSAVPGPDKQVASANPTGAESVEKRKATLESDSRCSHVEPHRVLCLLCNRHIGLHLKKDYSLVNWLRHVEACAKKTGSSNVTQSAPLVPHRRVSARILNESISTAPTRTQPVEEDEIVEISRNEVEAGLAKPAISNAGSSGLEKRKEILLGDVRISVVEPDRVLCKICNRWLKLNTQHPYTPSNWFKHVGRCERRRARDEGPASISAAAATTVVVKAQSPELVMLNGPSVTAPPALAPVRGRGRTAEERHELMRVDDRIRVLEPHKVQCGLCDRWIRLHNKIEYEPYNWYTHINKCALKARPESQSNPIPELGSNEETAPAPNSLVSQPVGRKAAVDKPPLLNAEGRREVLLLDGRATTVEPHRVLCALCSQWIKLKEDKAFVGHNFFKHIERCARRNEALSIAALSRAAAVPASTDVVVKTEEEPGLLGSAPLLKPKDEVRLAELLADPRQGGVEPGRVLCKMCNNWIKLNTSAGFLAGNWRRHAARCQKSSSRRHGAGRGGEDVPIELQAVEIIDLELEDEEGPIDLSLFGFVELGRLVNAFEPSISSTEFAIRQPDPPKEEKKATAAPVPMPIQAVRNLRARMSSASLTPKPEEPTTTASPNKRPHRSEASRKEELERDPRARTVHPEKILCAMCDKWIQMRRDISYSNQNWLKHAVSCQNRTGWSKKVDEPSKTPDKEEQALEPVEMQMEEILPFNARNRAATDEVEHETTISSFKPVDWQQEVIASDGEDEDDYYPISPGIFVPELVPAEKPMQREVMGVSVMVKQENSEVIDLTVSHEKERPIAVPTPLTFLHLLKNPSTNANGDQGLGDGMPPSLPFFVPQPLGANPAPGPKKSRKSSSKSPPTPLFSNPFTTAPLSRHFSNMVPAAPGSTLAPGVVAGRSIAEFVAAIHAEKNAGAPTSAHNHPATAHASTAATQPSAAQLREMPFKDVLTPTPPPPPFTLTTMPAPSFGTYTAAAHGYGRMLVPPIAHSNNNSGSAPSLVSAERPQPYMYGGIPVGGPSTFNMKQPTPNPAYYMRPPRLNAYPTPISAVMGPRSTPATTTAATAATSPVTTDDNRAVPPPSTAAVQLTPYANAPGARQIAPAPKSTPTPTPSTAALPMQSPLTAIMRDRPPMLYLMPAHLTIPNRTPPLPSPLSETSVDLRRSASAN